MGAAPFDFGFPLGRVPIPPQTIEARSIIALGGSLVFVAFKENKQDIQTQYCVGGRNPAHLEIMRNHYLKGIIMPEILGWCEMDFVRPQYHCIAATSRRANRRPPATGAGGFRACGGHGRGCYRCRQAPLEEADLFTSPESAPFFFLFFWGSLVFH